MEIRNVTTFVKIVECNSFTKAAESLGYSQAAVTAQIKAMESELGVPLFDRIGKRIYLTQEGKTFLPYAMNMLKAEEEAVHSVKQSQDLTGELSICSASSYAQTVLPEILREFLTIHPGVNVTVKVSDFLEDTTARVARGEIDFLACLDEENAHPEFLTAARRPERILFVTYPDNPVLDADNPRLEDVVNNQFIVADRDISYCAILERELRARDIDFRPVMEMGSVGAIVNMLLHGYGTSFIPEFAAAKHIERGDLVRLDISDIDTKLFSFFIYSKDRWVNPVMKEFIRIAEEFQKARPAGRL